MKESVTQTSTPIGCSYPPISTIVICFNCFGDNQCNKQNGVKWRGFVRTVNSLYHIILAKWFLLFWMCGLDALTQYCKLISFFTFNCIVYTWCKYIHFKRSLHKYPRIPDFAVRPALNNTHVSVTSQALIITNSSSPEPETEWHFNVPWQVIPPWGNVIQNWHYYFTTTTLYTLLIKLYCVWAPKILSNLG